MQAPIRFRAPILGIIFGLIICAATPYNNMYLRATLLAGGHFPLAPFFIAAWMMVAVAVISFATRTRPLLSGLEMLVVWILMVLVSGIGYTGLTRTFFINLTAPFHFATPGNRWAETLHPSMAGPLYPADESAVQTLYDGLDNGIAMGWWDILAGIPWASWITPLLWWGVFIGLTYFVMVCLTNMLARQWVENERVNFPLLRLPQVMAEAFDEKNLWGFFSNRYLLIGLALPVALHTINGLNSFIPDVPTIPTLILAGKYFPKYGLFSGFYKLKIYLYPAFIGFAYLVSRQISFSMWLFFILGGLLSGILAVSGVSIPSAAMGTTFGPTLAEVEETQMIGAYLVFFIFLVWLARYHLGHIIKVAFGLSPADRSNAEWFSLRLSFWGFVLGMAGLVAWCTAFGMSVLTAMLVMSVFFIFTLVASRVITQGGIAYFTLTAAPLDAVMAVFGTKIFANAGLLLTAVSQKVLFVDLRESLMPSLVHSAKIGEKVRNKRLFLFAIGFLLLFGVAVSFAAMLVLGHKFGLRELQLEWATYTTVNVYENVQRLMEAPTGPQPWVLTFAAIGAAVMLVLVLCYHRFYWWPIHPIGFLVTYSSAMRILWFSFFVGWLVNQLTLRYGGVSLFRKVRFFFFGLILGDFLMGGLWALIGLETGISYMVLPD